MSGIKVDQELRRISRRIRELEDARRRMIVETAQLRNSHSYRLGQAFVLFAKRRNPLAVGRLISDIRAALRPSNGELPPPPPKFYSPLLGKNPALRGMLERGAEDSPVGTGILARVVTREPRIVGIMSPESATLLGSVVISRELPYDRYDADWPLLRPTHLLIDVDHLSSSPGWEHAFTLNDPSTTVELAAMLMKARGLGLRTVLVAPSVAYRFPLLSRARPLFDIVIGRDEVGLDALTVQTTEAESA